MNDQFKRFCLLFSLIFILLILLSIFIASFLYANIYIDNKIEENECTLLIKEGFQIKIIDNAGAKICKIVYKEILFDPEYADEINLLRLKDDA